MRRIFQSLRKKAKVADPTITNVTDQRNKQYEISVDGTQAGSASYIDTGGQRIFYEVQTKDEFAGHGLATKLVDAALTDTREAGKRIVAICPFVAAYLDNHEEYDDIVDPITPEAHVKVQAALG